jgi:hypothetical protein
MREKTQQESMAGADRITIGPAADAARFSRSFPLPPMRAGCRGAAPERPA